MNWTKYFNTDILFIDDNSYLSKLNLLTKKNYLDTLKIKEEVFLKELEELKEMTLSKINIEHYKSKNSLQLLEAQKNIILTLNRYCLKLNKIDFNFIINSLNYILEISNILKKRTKQTDIVLVAKDTIQRCSYKFCKFKENCTYNYSHRKNVCYQDHYVHNMVICDLNQIINFISKNSDTLQLNDFSKSINTISFVINHMYKELNSRCLYIKLDKEIEKEHISKNKINRFKK
tara:strand:- start:400 stop:1095 length:696 start_codon:yes stop_codon:yes gene_type:complete